MDCHRDGTAPATMPQSPSTNRYQKPSAVDRVVKLVILDHPCLSAGPLRSPWGRSSHHYKQVVVWRLCIVWVCPIWLEIAIRMILHLKTGVQLLGSLIHLLERGILLPGIQAHREPPHLRPRHLLHWTTNGLPYLWLWPVVRGCGEAAAGQAPGSSHD